MQFVTLVNRSSKTLQGTWDGKHYDLAPGKHSFPEIQAMKFKEQNPVMGSEDPRTLMKEYLMGIVELGDNCEPIEQSAAIELWDRNKLGNADDVKVIRGNGLYSQQLDKTPALPFDGPGFTKA